MDYKRLNRRGNEYEKSGVYSLAIRAYETCLFYGFLTPSNYIHLARLYKKQDDIYNSERVLRRYNQIYGVFQACMKDE